MQGPLSQPERERVKAACRHLVAACGGGEGGRARACELAGVSAGELSKWLSPDYPDLPRLAAVMAWTVETGSPAFAQVLAGACDHRLVPLSEAEARAERAALIDRLVGLQSRNGATTQVFADALADGVVTGRERRDVLDAIHRQIDDLHKTAQAVAQGGDGETP